MNDRFSTTGEGNVIADALCGALMIVWGVVRIPILVVLAFLEPFVRFVLIGIAILSVLVALVSKGSSAPPEMSRKTETTPIKLLRGIVMIRGVAQRIFRTFLSGSVAIDPNP